VSVDYDDLPKRIVDGIRLYFGYNAVYTIYQKLNEKDYAITELYGEDTYSRDHVLYKEIWAKNDIFFNKLDVIVNGSKTLKKYAWRCQDLGCSIEEFWNLDLGKAIRKGGFGYKALITCGQPWYNMQHTISLYKPEKQGDFSDEEMEKFNYIGTLFSIMQNNYRDKIENEQLKSVLNKHITDMDGCFCVLNCQLNVIFQTNAFSEIADKIFNGELFRHTLMPLVARMGEVEHSNESEISKEYNTENGNYVMNISIFSKDKNESYKTQYLYMIKIQAKKDDTPSMFNEIDAIREGAFYLKTSETYCLTRRETEVLKLMMNGLKVAEIAEKICVAKSTARTHINNIYRKLGVNNRSETMAKIMMIKDTKI
jgi:DNA-binding CsgD family transcriptional regulator